MNNGALPGFDENLGHGRIDANASISRYALAGDPPPTANLTRPKYEQCVRGKTHIYGYSDVASSHAGSYELSYSSTLQGAYTLISSGAITGGVAPGEVYLGTVAPATFPSTGRYYLKLETTDTDTGVVSTDYNEIEVCGGCAALPFPPVAWWRFDRASFPVALDSAGANHGAYSGDGGPGPNGRVNDGLGVFGKWTDYMTAPASSPPSFYTMSVQGWIRRSVGQDAVIASYSADGVHGWELGMYSTGAIYFAENLHDGITRVVGTVGMSSLYQWMHVAAVVKPQSGNALAPIKINLYLNGVLDNSLSYTMSTVLNPPLSSPTYRVGSAASLTGMGILSFPGNIDEIQVFNQALPASAVASSHAAKCGGNCL